MIKSIIKYAVEVCFNMDMLFKMQGKKRNIFLFLTPQYLNYGDHAIATAEKQYLEKYYSGYGVEEINYSFYQYWPLKAKKMVREEDIIVITGGGYAGDLWPENQHQLEQVIKMFSNNRIVLAPTTVFYKKVSENADLESFKNIIHNHKDLYVIAREKNTYQLLQKAFQMEKGRNLFILPDFVLTMALENQISKRKGVAFCFRDDEEKVMSLKDVEAIKASLHIKEEEIARIKMAKNHVEIPVFLRNWFLKRKLSEYYQRELVITDRLHGMLFCAITETPCVALDNISHKISGAYQSIASLSYIALASDVESIPKLVRQVSSVLQNDRERELKELRSNIREEYKDVFQLLIEGHR